MFRTTLPSGITSITPLPNGQFAALQAKPRLYASAVILDNSMNIIRVFDNIDWNPHLNYKIIPIGEHKFYISAYSRFHQTIRANHLFDYHKNNPATAPMKVSIFLELGNPALYKSIEGTHCIAALLGNGSSFPFIFIDDIDSMHTSTQRMPNMESGKDFHITTSHLFLLTDQGNVYQAPLDLNHLYNDKEIIDFEKKTVITQQRGAQSISVSPNGKVLALCTDDHLLIYLKENNEWLHADKLRGPLNKKYFFLPNQANSLIYLHPQAVNIYHPDLLKIELLNFEWDTNQKHDWGINAAGELWHMLYPNDTNRSATFTRYSLDCVTNDNTALKTKIQTHLIPELSTTVMNYLFPFFDKNTETYHTSKPEKNPIILKDFLP